MPGEQALNLPWFIGQAAKQPQRRNPSIRCRLGVGGHRVKGLPESWIGERGIERQLSGSCAAQQRGLRLHPPRLEPGGGIHQAAEQLFQFFVVGLDRCQAEHDFHQF